MSQLIVRNIEAEVVRALRRRAARHGRSAEAEHREILRSVLLADSDGKSFNDLLASMPDLGTDEDFVPERDVPRPTA